MEKKCVSNNGVHNKAWDVLFNRRIDWSGEWNDSHDRTGKTSSSRSGYFGGLGLARVALVVLFVLTGSNLWASAQAAFSASGVASSTNSTTTPLAAGATFYGGPDNGGEQNDFDHVGVMAKMDSDATLFFQFSSDGVNWDSTFPTGGFKISSGIPEFHTAVKLGRYFRLRIANNDTPQTSMRTTTFYGNNFVPSAAPLNQALGIDHDAIMVRSTLSQDEIRIGRRSGVVGWTKFGHRLDLQSASGEETIWASTNNFVPLMVPSTFSVVYDETTDGDGTTGATVLTFWYVNSSGTPAISVHTLGNTGADETSFSGLGINRIAVSASGSNNANVSEIVVSTEAGGNTQAIVPAGGSVTQQCIYFVGSNHQAVAKFLIINANKVSGSAPVVTIKGYAFNRNIQTQFEVFRYVMDANVENNVILNEPIGFNLSPSDILFFVADTTLNNTVVNLRFSLNEYQNN